MQLHRYQDLAQHTAYFPKTDPEYAYACMGLAGEVGELLNNLKKVHRDHCGNIPTEMFPQLSEEVGDIFWYLCLVCNQLGISAEDCCIENLRRLVLKHSNRKGVQEKIGLFKSFLSSPHS
jgi:NTP pyrophosphatase (non-canonical NTP hydrolase)